MAGWGRYRRHVHGRGADRRCERGRSASPRCRPRRATSRRACCPRCEMAMQRYGLAAADVGLLSHATTVVTNAILRGEGRPRGPDHHARLSRRAGAAALGPRATSTTCSRMRRPRSIPRRRRFEITERIGADGEVVTPLAEAEIDGLIAALKARARRRRWPSRCCSASSTPSTSGGWARACARRCRTSRSTCPPRCCPRSRSSSAPARRRCAPTSGRSWPPTWSGWRSATRAQGLPPLYVMGSNGGILEAGETVAMPAMAVESGPAAGVVAAALVARQTGRPQPALLRHGRHHRQGQPDPQRPVRDDARVRGRRRRQRQPLDARHRPSDPRARHRPGRGVGRRRLDRLGRPGRRAARRPAERRRRSGPVCYARGGTEPTVTDCNLLLGYLDKGSLLAGDLPIDHAAAEAAIAKRLAEPLGVDVRTAAAAVIDVVNHAMAEALKIVSVQRGHDPREFVLAAFGGAGPLHAAALAAELGIAEISARRSPAPSRRSA